MKFWTCPYCHAHLDWGEVCSDCQKDKVRVDQETEIQTDRCLEDFRFEKLPRGNL